MIDFVIGKHPAFKWDTEGTAEELRLALDSESFAWVQENLPEDLRVLVYRIDFHEFPTPRIVVYRYARDDGDSRYILRPGSGLGGAVYAPVAYLVDALPPEHLRPRPQLPVRPLRADATDENPEDQ